MRLPFLASRADQQLKDFLMAHADALVAGDLDVDRLLAHYDGVAREQVQSFIDVAERVSQALPEVAPSEQFVAYLRMQLSDAAQADQVNWWERMRQLSPRTQLAAGIGGATLTAGVVLLATRPLLDALDDWRERRDTTT